MPIYEYECRKCHQRLEALQRVSEPPLTTCPECAGELRKLLSAPAFQFKGEGWYVTDYARKKEGAKGEGKSEKAAKESTAEGKTEGAKEGKGESAKGAAEKATAASGASGS